MADCKPLQKSLNWCEGKPVLPGIRRKLYYTSKSNIAKWPTLPTDAAGRPTSAVYVGSFVLVADATWKVIDVLSEKSQLTSEAQGEAPSQTQLNKLTAVHPDIGPEATAASAYLNNSDNVFIMQDMTGRYRVVGADLYSTKTTVAQDLGQGATGTASTTITAEAPDVVAAPFYEGEIVTEDGTIEASGSQSGSTNTGSGSTNTGSGSTNTGSGGSSSGSGSTNTGNGGSSSGSGSVPDDFPGYD